MQVSRPKTFMRKPSAQSDRRGTLFTELLPENVAELSLRPYANLSGRNAWHCPLLLPYAPELSRTRLL